MKVNAGNMGLFNVYRANQSMARQNGSNSLSQADKAERRDRITVTPQGKVNGLMESFIKQKMTITEQKNALISSTLEKGGTMESIKSQLENYDEQLKNIDQQMADMMVKEMEKQGDNVQKPDDGEPKTEEQLQNERLANMSGLATDIQYIKTIDTIKSKMNGDAGVLQSEIELDKDRLGSSAGAKKLIAKKEEKLSDMAQKSSKLMAEIADRLSDTVEKADDLNTPQAILPDDETRTDSKTDEQKSSVEPLIHEAEDKTVN